MIHIVNEKDMDMKLRQLCQVYTWYFQKLVAMGALSPEEEEREMLLLNPNKNNLADTMRAAIK